VDTFENTLYKDVSEIKRKRRLFYMLNNDVRNIHQQLTAETKSYVLITPCRNEVAYIEGTLKAVVEQTVRPKVWVIVSDGSTDGTDEVVERYAEQHDFILLLRRPENRQRNFGSKVESIDLAYEHLRELQFDFVGNLDADVTFASSYYARILSKFEQNEHLGVAGGRRLDVYDGRLVPIRRSQNSVSGAVQLFRRSCYEAIGGYQRLSCGGVDAVAETMARMHGWQVESFSEIKFYHHRPTGTASGGVIKARFKSGMQHRMIGYHPVFHLASSMFHLFSYPFFIGSLVSIAGYIWAILRRYEIVVPDDYVRFLRAEQKARLRSLLRTGKDPASHSSMRLKQRDDQMTPAGQTSIPGQIQE
jgi:biofilm PGA synthesis N-glycosyltransferase PgaC